MTFVDMVRESLGALPGSTLTDRSPPIVSSCSSLTMGDCALLEGRDEGVSLLDLRSTGWLSPDGGWSSSMAEEPSRLGIVSALSGAISIFSTWDVTLLSLASREAGMALLCVVSDGLARVVGGKWMDVVSRRPEFTQPQIRRR